MKLNEIKKIEKVLIKFNFGNFFSKKIKLTGGLALFCEDISDDTYLNYVTNIHVEGDINKFIQKVEKLYISKGSTPAFYILPTTFPKNMEKVLIKKGYKLFCSDAWMSFDLNKKVNMFSKNMIIRRAKLEELKIVKQVFNEVFTKGEPDDPYRNLSHLYGELFYKRIASKHGSYNSEVYVALIENKIVGICNILYDRETAILEGLAILPKFRKMGVAKALLHTCIKRAQDVGLKRLFLWTEKDSRNENVFVKCGFKTEVVSKTIAKN